MTTQRLRELLAAATPLPWRVEEDDEGTYVWAEAAPHGVDPALWDGCVAVVSGPTDEPEPDAALICAAVNALPALLEVAEAARTLSESLPEWTSSWNGERRVSWPVDWDGGSDAESDAPAIALRDAIAALDRLAP